MVVDDSAAMRALFSGILENAKDVEVCGVASGADEAREKLAELKPDVLTLDVEMPGMTGMEFLAEIMETRPMPVIMLSSIAQAGSGTAAKALELGAVHCFPKPLRSSPEEFDKNVAQLGDIVVRAHRRELEPGGGDQPAGEDSPASAPADAGTASSSAAFADYVSNGSPLVLACGKDGLTAAGAIVMSYPAACPPTVLLVDADRESVESAISDWGEKAACNVAEAEDGASLEPGAVHVVFDKGSHFILEAGSPPRLKSAVRDPVGGIRPCADLLLGSIARARIAASAGLLAGSGSDGAKGLQILQQAGGSTFVEEPESGLPQDRLTAVKGLGVEADTIPTDEIAEWIAGKTAKS
jgi:two-component system chemotaxis response regulator CheB